jgi:hypothetical protein
MVQLLSVNQQTMEAKIRYQETSSEDNAEEFLLRRAAIKYWLVETDSED